MITKLTGVLVRVLDEEVRVAVGPFEYQVLVPEAVRRQLQLRTGQEVTLHISEYIEGNQAGSRFVPRKVGFNTEAELEFFDLFCTVEKIGVKKALKALARSVREIADAISRQDVKWLTTLPGIGAATAEQIVTTLKRKVAGFALGPGEAVESTEPAKGKKKPAADASADPAQPSARLIEDVYEALVALGMSPLDAREKLDKVLQAGPFADVQEAINRLYARG